MFQGILGSTDKVRRSGCAALLVAGLGALASGATGPLGADEVIFLEAAATWKFLPGTGEPPVGWREADFNDGSWQSGPAPLGFNEANLGTDFALLDPPMRNSYTSMYLRTTFEIDDPAAVTELHAAAEYDDGILLWINGTEVLRLNLRGSPGEAVAYDAIAIRSHEGAGRTEDHLLENFEDYLVAGENVVAVQLHNQSIGGADLWFQLQLADPFGPDLVSPDVATLVPAAETTVRRLFRIEVTFDEEVSGVDSADLLVNGVPATSVAGTAAGPYVFEFPQPEPGPVQVRWADDHQITDQAPAANPFAGGSWSYTLDPDAPPPSLVISEFVAASYGAPLDEDREDSDWIEIYNAGDEPVTMGGWSLTDERDQPGKWVFPQVPLGAGEYLIVFASGKDRSPADGGNLHTNFKLNPTGEYLALFSAESPRELIMEFEPEFPEQRAGYSYGLDAGGSMVYFDSPTPGASNESGTVFPGFVAAPRFSVGHGFYDEAFDLELRTATASASIYYTLDGSEPTEDSGTLYEGPIRVEGTPQRAAITVRAAAFREGLLPSTAATRTYIFAEHVLTQPRLPGGFPTVWGSGAPSVDYEMDPEIVNNESYTHLILEGLKDIPSISIVTDVAHMFEARGIYSNPGGTGPAWERPASAELILPDGSEGFQANCGVRIQGGASRRTDKSPKHSFRLLFKGDYGPTKLRYRVFPDSPVDSFDTLILRAGFNNSWIHWAGEQRQRCQYNRDQWARDTQLDMGGVSGHGRHVHVYVNGLYWGLFILVERPNAAFAASYLGGEKEDYDALNSAEPVDGNLAAWNELMSAASRSNFADPAQYLALQDMLDFPSFIDYMIINIYGDNADWPHHNWYAARRREPGSQWRFFSWDAERILESPSASSELNASDGNSPGIIYARLRQSPEFRLLFADHVHRHLFNGGALTPEAAAERWEKRAEEIENAVVCESARWGDYRRDVHSWSGGPYLLYTLNGHWLPERNRLSVTYFPRRSDILLNLFRSVGLYPTVGAPVFNQHGGNIEPGFELTMSLPAGTEGSILYTTDGSDPRVPFSGEASPSATVYDAPVVLREVTHVKARALRDATWSALNEATFSVDTDPGAIHITEIMYHPEGGSLYEFLEVANLGEAPVDFSGAQFTNGVNFTFPENTTMQPGERFVLAANRNVFWSRYPDVPLKGVFTGNLENAGEKVTLRDAGGHTLVSVDYKDSGFWPLGPDGFGYSLVLADAAGDPDSPDSWRASAQVHGSPGEEDPPGLHGGVIVNEVLASGERPFEAAIEIHNVTSRTVDIGGWYLSDSRADANSLQKFRIPSGTVLHRGGYAVFYEYEFHEDPESPSSFMLDPMGGEVYLSGADSTGALSGYIRGAEYEAAEGGVSFGRHVTSVGQDFTRLDRPSFGVDDPQSVEEFRTGSGSPNSRPRIGAVIVNEIMYHPPEGSVEFVELHNRTDSPAALFDAAIGRGWQLRGLFDDSGDSSFEFAPGAEIPAGGFVVVVPLEPDLFRELYAVPEEVFIFGPYAGALDNAGERLRLSKPAGLRGETVVYSTVDQVRYNDRDPWAVSADGLGPSLERIFAFQYANDPDNWGASLEAEGTPGRWNSISPPVEGGRQMPSDINQDAELDISDAIGLLGHLFLGSPASLPCQGGTIEDEGNLKLLDADGNRNVNLADALRVLVYLFQSGPPPALGTECVMIPGCRERCL